MSIVNVFRFMCHCHQTTKKRRTSNEMRRCLYRVGRLNYRLYFSTFVQFVSIATVTGAGGGVRSVRRSVRVLIADSTGAPARASARSVRSTTAMAARRWSINAALSAAICASAMLKYLVCYRATTKNILSRAACQPRRWPAAIAHLEIIVKPNRASLIAVMGGAVTVTLSAVNGRQP